MAQRDFDFELIATSPFVRARETTDIVAAALDQADRVRIWEGLVPGGSPDTICHELGRFNEDATLLLVGHEPLLSSLISRIIAGDSGSAIVMTPGGLAKIRNFSFSRRPAGELHWLLTARQIAGMVK
jgi:phosphohistidine phosphatase